MLESVEFAAESLKGNRLRTALSLVGIIIGVASVVAVTTIAASGSAEVKKQFDVFGLDAVQVYATGDRGRGKALLELDRSLAREILARIPAAKAVLLRTELEGSFFRRRNSEAARAALVEAPYFEAMNASMALGRAFSPEEEYRARAVAVLGDGIARSLFPEGSPLGGRLEAMVGGQAISLEVVGILAPKEPFFIDEWDRTVYLPWTTGASRISGELKAGILTVIARDRAQVVGLGVDLEALLLAKTADPGAFGVVSPRQWAEQNEKLTRTISLIFTGVAAISLLVGGIGVMNIMLVSVTERKKEIGLRKALGATRRDIRLQFLVEALILTGAGGLLGMGLGLIISFFAVKAFAWAFVLSPATAFLALGVSGATGLFSGLYPAVRASRLEPVEALAAE